MKELKEYPGYYLEPDGKVFNAATGKYQTHTLNCSGNPYVRIKVGRTRKVLLISKLMDQYYPKFPLYVKPVCEDLSEPGETWKRVPWANSYMVSNHRRVWSWKSLKFLCKDGSTAKSRSWVQIGQRGITIERLYAETFGPDIPHQDGEEWKPSVAPGIWVSNLGRLWSSWRQNLLKQHINSEGYLAAAGYRTHRLVACAFCGDGSPALEVDHINENKMDNRACNLEWVTKDENLRRYAVNHYGQPGGGVKR